jgi:hypothetical protein
MRVRGQARSGCSTEPWNMCFRRSRGSLGQSCVEADVVRKTNVAQALAIACRGTGLPVRPDGMSTEATAPLA